MALLEQYTFTVPTKGLCIMCLADDASSKPRQFSIHSISSYLNLDFRKIFNIKVPKIYHADGSEIQNDSVDIKVTLCRSCSDLRNKFSDLYGQLEGIHQRLNSCVETMQEVMINSESNAIRSRHYREQITGGQGSLATSQVAELVKSSIPDKFRKETIIKCIFQSEKAKMRKAASLSNKPKNEVADFGRDFGLADSPFDEENNSQDFSDDEAMKIDEDADPEELMMRYNSFPESYKYEDPGWMGAGSSAQDENEMDGQFGLDETGSGSATDNRSSTFNSKYECNHCGKVVVSLKNYELHQRRHTGEKPFACPFCDQHFRDTSNLRSHTLRYHRQFLFAKFKDESLTEEQFKLALDKIVQSIVQVSEGVGVSHQSHQCVLCNKDYTQKYAIEDHIVQRHYDVLATAIINLQKDAMSYNSQEIAQYLEEVQESENTCTICGLCGQEFPTGLELNSHMKVHVRVKVARNQGSIQKTNTSDSLIQLKMKCNFCSKYFEDLTALTRHKALHRGGCGNGVPKDSIYNCEHCGRSFCSYYSQRSHVLSFHRYEVFSRYLPSNTTSAEIEGVIKGITGKYKKLPNGMFQCSLCTKEITQSRKLQSHMLVTHFDEVVEKLKVAIHKIHKGEGDPPELDQYEDNSGSMLGNIAIDEQDEEDMVDGNIACIVSLEEGEQDEDGNSHLELNYPA